MNTKQHKKLTEILDSFYWEGAVGHVMYFTDDEVEALAEHLINNGVGLPEEYFENEELFERLERAKDALWYLSLEFKARTGELNAAGLISLGKMRIEENMSLEKVQNELNQLIVYVAQQKGEL